jgi:Putative DNA-binding domain
MSRPPGLKPPPRRAPRRVDSVSQLRAFQRLMTHALVCPLEEDGGPARWMDGRTMDAVAAEFIKPNDRLSSLERLEIYHRTYWTRLIESATDDCPGLLSLLGEARFHRLLRAYLHRYPSRSFTLRDLCSRLPRFIREEPRWTAPRTRLAAEVAEFEWAQTQAFDAPARPLPTPAGIAAIRPEALRLSLQPHVFLLRLGYPVDAYLAALRRRSALREEASNAPGGGAVRASRARRVPAPRPGLTYLALHRVGGRLRTERLTRQGFRILQAIRAGKPLARALGAGGRIGPDRARSLFADWMKFGFFCRPSKKTPNP